eukprot:CAMPEP_0113663096 /NCGR_PEP_ID=MMETSP0038_2-20120614/946_1 /TAXON_ID=2898 /ORGANISM="Cryptomonas paramecium" /LENGTH=128 /DNA_ID=CAMNT_0000578073 /DNA_START=212 /DNA_END=595 /DNA_ORIENTATION=+ /assembly_acc=CAM_ASM_000170
MSNAGHTGKMSSGSGTVQFQRNGVALACGASLIANEQLTLTSTGTSGDELYQVTGSATITGGDCTLTRTVNDLQTVVVGASGSVVAQVNYGGQGHGKVYRSATCSFTVAGPCAACGAAEYETATCASG